MRSVPKELGTEACTPDQVVDFTPDQVEECTPDQVVECTLDQVNTVLTDPQFVF